MARSPFASPPGWCLRVGMIFLSAVAPPRAMADPEIVPLSMIAGPTSLRRVSISERSPLSAPAEVIKRLQLKQPQGEDYDVSKEVFNVVFPRQPAADGKYGLIVGLCFKESGQPPAAWCEVMEKYHLIWLSVEGSGNERALVQRVGLMLDMVHSAQKIWTLDENRIYASINTIGPVGGVALYYPEVFQGAIHTVGWRWFRKIQYKRIIYDTEAMAQPAAEQMALARSRSRFFLVCREGESEMEQIVLKHGYLQSGFQHAAMLVVPPAEMNHYQDYLGTWFEEGVKFLDAPLANRSSATQKAAATAPAVIVKPAQPPGSSTEAGTSKVTEAESANKAAKDLGMAKNYVALQKYDAARAKLRKLIEAYPTTPAAKEAKGLLQEIEEK
jgi:hypothetical protein